VVILAIDVQHKDPGYPAPASTFPACRIGMENNGISPATRQREPKGFLRCEVLISITEFQYSDCRSWHWNQKEQNYVCSCCSHPI